MSGERALSVSDETRYLRQIAIESIGAQGQRRLKGATAAVMGVGGLGSPVSSYLAAAGVGRLILVDFQAPELSNLNRQVLHWERNVSEGKNKAFSAAEKLQQMNSEIEVVPKIGRIGESDLKELIGTADVVLDCLDNFDARMRLNQFCVSEGMPFVHAAVEGFSGQLTAVVPGKTPCLSCIFHSLPKSKGVIPIIGCTAGVFGSLEAAEAIKMLTGAGRPLLGRMLVGDIAEQYWETVELERRTSCAVCGRGH